MLYTMSSTLITNISHYLILYTTSPKPYKTSLHLPKFNFNPPIHKTLSLQKYPNPNLESQILSPKSYLLIETVQMPKYTRKS